MRRLAGILVAERNVRLLAAVVFCASFVAVLALLGAIVHNRVTAHISNGTLADFSAFISEARHVDTAFESIARDVTAEPCSPAFQDQMRRVAYLPDGINELFYAPGGTIRCSAMIGRLAEAYRPSAADFSSRGTVETRYFVHRDLGFLGLPGLKGTLILREPFGVVVTADEQLVELPSWARAEAVLAAQDGRWWHRGGAEGIYRQASMGSPTQWLPFDGAARLTDLICEDDGRRCVAWRIDPAELVRQHWPAALVIVLFAGFVATWSARMVTRFVRRYWSLESRVARHLDERSMVCVYQPIVELSSGRIVGCEVLARWRDVDGSIRYPDTFLPVVEALDLSRKLNRVMAAKAFTELSGAGLEGPLQVNFNILPRDLDSRELRQVFAPFLMQRERFQPAIEVVENASIDIADARGAILALRLAGFRVYIDDFGAGYSTVQSLAALSVDGVKLDRAFAMAPPDSLMSEMLAHAVAMIATAGAEIVVEGVETAARLAQLRDHAGVDFVQGYYLSRPLDIAAFSDFVRRGGSQEAPDCLRAA